MTNGIRGIERTKASRQHPKTRAQALLEFALALPVLLLILFGIIEMGRLTQAWMAVQNSARFGLRYAVTGEYNPQYCELAANSLGYAAADSFGSSPTGYDCEVQRAYCESLPAPQQESCDYEQMTSELQDWARLPSSRDSARAGVAGAAVDDTEAVIGDYLAYLISHDLGELGDPTASGYYHVTLCSGRDDDGDGLSDFQRVEYTDPETCLKINTLPNIYIDDPGGPGDRVRVTVTYVHPMIMPLLSSVWPRVPLTAWREGIVEQFRVARMGGVGGQIGLAPTLTPIPPTPTDTPIPPTPTDTPVPPTPTDIPTQTSTSTATATLTPSCDALHVNGPLTFNGDDVQISLSNTSNQYPITLGLAEGNWAEREGQAGGPWHDQVDPLPADQYLDVYTWGGSTFLDVSPNVALDSPPTSWANNLGLNILPLQTNSLGLDFNLSFTASAIYYHAHDFLINLSYSVGSLSCPAVAITGRYGPIVSIVPQPPDPITEPFTIEAAASDPDGTINQVNFEVWNESETTILGSTDDAGAPYCLFGDSGGECLTRGLGNVWPNSSNPIQNGTYVIYIEARDNDPHNQYTRIRQTIHLALPELVACNNVGTGLMGEYYNWVGNSPPNFGGAALAHARIDPQVSFNWGSGSPHSSVTADHFAVRWYGQVQPRYDQQETYTFFTRTDDGVRLWVNGQLLVSHWQDQSGNEWSGSITFGPGCGLYAIEIEYYEHHSSALAELSWQGESVGREIVPQANLYPPLVSLPATSTPTSTPVNTATATSTATSTPRTPTVTPTPTTPGDDDTPTPTATSEVIITLTPTPTATNTEPAQPSQTPTQTPSPTPCQTPPDLGGCR